MAIFSPLFSLLGEWVPQLSLSFRHPNVATGSTHPIHIRLTGTSDTSRIHNLHGDTQNLTTLPEACPAISHIRHHIPSNRSGEARFCRVVGSCPSIPYSHFSPSPSITMDGIFLFFSCDSYKLHVGNTTGLRNLAVCRRQVRGLKRRDTRHLWTLHVYCPALGLPPAGEAE